ncbi:hypothetical protein LPJ72_001552 [Coemansia sp. Benny D160-2]|nr:hypothetical protein LPJ72_001552 [Coemansia sp. Benny D160-2]
MDTFIAAVKQQTFPLSGADSYSACVTIPLYYYFENKSSSAQFMPSALLKDSFYTTLQEFSFFAGHLHMKNGGVGAYIAVDPQNLNMPEYTEHNSDSVSFNDLKAAGYSPNALPTEISKADIFSTENADNVIKLVRIKVARLQNNTGVVILVNPVHALADAYGFCEFMKRWSHVCREIMAAPGDQASSSDTGLLTERKALYDSLPENGQPMDETTAKVLGKKSLLSVLLAWLSPEKRAEFLDSVTPCAMTDNHVFYLSNETLRGLKETVNEAVAAAASNTRLSSNDIITAILTMVSVQCNQAHDGDPDDETIIVNFPVDFRKRLSNPSMTKYTGNCVVAPMLPFQYSDLRAKVSSESLAVCALKVRRLVDLVTPEYVRQCFDLIDTEPDCIMRATAYSSSIASGFCLSNHSRIDYYGVDFGCGTPVWINPPSTYVPNYATILPTSTYDGGCYIYLSLLKGDMERALQHKFWRSVTELVN